MENKEFEMNEELMNNIGKKENNIYAEEVISEAALQNDIPIVEKTGIKNSDKDSTDKISSKKKTIIILILCTVLLVVLIFVGFKIKQHNDNLKIANNVISMINDIGEVYATDESKQKISAAQNAYDSLTDIQKEYVSNIDTLITAQKTYNDKNTTLNMLILATTLKNNAELCQAFFSDYSSVWYNAIYRKTDEYNNGDFSDFNNALIAFQKSDTYASAQNTLNTLNKTITNTWVELKDANISDAETYEALKNVYTAYLPMYSLAVNPEGSYRTYTEEVQRLNSNYKTAYAVLSAAMPALESSDSQNY